MLTTGNKSELAVGLLDAVRRLRRRLQPAQGRAEDDGVAAGSKWRNAEADPTRRDTADPGELDRQAAERRAAPGPARHRLAARLRGARRVLADYIEADHGAADLLAAGHDPALVDRVLGWSTWPSTSVASPQDPRSPSRRSGATAGCPSPANGEKTSTVSGPRESVDAAASPPAWLSTRGSQPRSSPGYRRHVVGVQKHIPISSGQPRA